MVVVSFRKVWGLVTIKSISIREKHMFIEALWFRFISLGVIARDHLSTIG